MSIVTKKKIYPPGGPFPWDQDSTPSKKIYQDPSERIRNTQSIYDPTSQIPLPLLTQEVHRCTNCGTADCQGGDYTELTNKLGIGCPLGRPFPEWQSLLEICLGDGTQEPNPESSVFKQLVEHADSIPLLFATCYTCPAPCEKACSHAQDGHAGGVKIKLLERYIYEQARKRNLLKPLKVNHKNGKKVAIVGSGPAAFSAAFYLNKNGYEVHIFEAKSRAGGMMADGIPHWHLPPEVLEFETQRLILSGVNIHLNSPVDFYNKEFYEFDESRESYDAVILACGTRHHKKLEIEGAQLKNIHYALDVLTHNGKFLRGELKENIFNCQGETVAVLGGGDTGQDAIATLLRLMNPKKILMIHKHPEPNEERASNNPWPQWPKTQATFRGYAYQEALEDPRYEEYLNSSILKIYGDTAIKGIDIADNILDENGKISGYQNQRKIEIDRLIISIGFESFPESKKKDLKLEFPKVFFAGDMETGPGLVVIAGESGRRAAKNVHRFLFPEGDEVFYA